MKLFYTYLVLLISVIYALADVYQVKDIGSSIKIRKNGSSNSAVVGTLKSKQYIYVTSTKDNWAKFYKGYVSMKHLTKVNGKGNFKTTEHLKFRTGPSTDYKIINTIKKGNIVTYFGKDPFYYGWAVTNEGYASLKYLTPKDSGSEANTLAGAVYQVNNISSLKIRKSENTNGDISGTLKNGQYIYVTSNNSKWAKFYKGYVSMKYLKKVSGKSNYKTTTKYSFRTGPSEGHKITTTLNKDSVVIYFDKDPFTSGWAVTNKGYASLKYITPKDSVKPSGDSGNSGNSGDNSSRDASTPGATVAREVYNFFKEKGWTKNAICGMLGNMEYESDGLVPTRNEYGGGGGYGLLQWTPATKLQNWANENGFDYTTVTAQCQRIQYEFEGHIIQYLERSCGLSFDAYSKSTESVEYLTGCFAINYENPDSTALQNSLATRQSYARKWFDYL